MLRHRLRAYCSLAIQPYFVSLIIVGLAATINGAIQTAMFKQLQSSTPQWSDDNRLNGTTRAANAYTAMIGVRQELDSKWDISERGTLFYG